MVGNEVFSIVFKILGDSLKCTLGLYFGLQRLSRLTNFGFEEKQYIRQ